ncbi:MAG: hypothetical protein IPN98_15920 [Propionivibrio sp.]|nr:hypothetical protein [Propionivibrio sp.]
MSQVLAAVPTSGLDAVLVAVELVIESGGPECRACPHVLVSSECHANAYLRGNQFGSPGGSAMASTPVVTDSLRILTTWG